MKAIVSGVSAVVFAVVASACHSPANPTATGYAGQWSGTTAQGKPIAFTVSPDEAVTSITVGYDFNSCSGSQTFSNLTVSIAPNVMCIPGPCPASVSSYRAFNYTSGNPIGGPSTDLNGLFVSTARAEGLVNFRNYPGCGSAPGVAWSATRE